MHSVIFAGKEITPSKIVCVGRNFVEHIAELGNEIPDEMVVFNKPNSAISNELVAVHGEPLHYEAEICFVIKNNTLAGVGCGLDLTKRQLQAKLKAKGLPWERAKAFDGAALFSEFADLPDNTAELAVKLYVDDSLRQHGETSMMMYKPEYILAELQTYTHLEDGDVIMTGTPAGAGGVVAGSVYECQVLFGETVLARSSWLAK